MEEQPKPGIHSSEFYISLAVTILGALMSTGVIIPDSTVGKIIGAVLMVAAALGYTASRTLLKK